MTDEKPVEITAAKGRPMLSWVGKRPLSRITPFPAQHIETFDATTAASERWTDWPERYPQGGLLFHGDNKEVLAHLLANGFRGKVDLIYIDPPFDSGADYVRRVRLRGATGTAQLDAEGYTIGEQIQYADIWANDNYLQFMYERLLLMKELLAENGSIYVHMDSNRGHQVKIVLDEVFGSKCFQREIIWRIGWISGYKTAANNWIRNHDTIFYYTKHPSDFTFNKLLIRYHEGYTRRDGKTPEGNGIPLEDTWNCSDADRLDSIQIMSFSGEKVNFPTQKNEDLLTRIMLASSNPGDTVLDCFIGSGTTAAVAQKLGRRWIGCDINRGAIQTTAKRLHTIINEQAAPGDDNGQGKLVDGEDAPLKPAQLAFSNWRVNDYDLQIQQNEAINLACEHIGIQRSRIDSFFDGVLGRNLVKIIPFNHPLSPLDLDEIRKELAARPEDDRSITVVCLGKELAVEHWLADWNLLHSAANSIEVIELRTDPKYGKFFEHKPASAQVTITRDGDEIYIKIEDFVSPTIIERLAAASGLLQPHIDDWRAMVDSVMVDLAYEGEVFNVCLSDVPERRNGLVQGAYALPAPDGDTTVAVKIIDMLGEEVLVTKGLPAD